MSGMQEYKCPNCGGSVEFDSNLQKVKCSFCDTEFEPQALEEYQRSLNSGSSSNMTWESTAGREWTEGEADGLKVYTCKSCGGEIVGDDSMAATSCPYCNNPVVMTGQLSGELRPDRIIPFKLDKNAAKEGLKRHVMGKRLLPKVFKDENHIDEIKGIYVPFWLFHADVDAGMKYKATRRRTRSDSSYHYTYTDYYMVEREGSMGFDNVPVDGSKKMADDLMESIEPYDINEAVDFNTAYLAGYLADKYDVSMDESIVRANERIRTSMVEAFAKTVESFHTVETEGTNISLSKSKAEYALLPVWILNTKWKGNTYTFAMNGQTGKFVGDLPVDKGAELKYRLTTAIGTFVLVYGIMWGLRFAGVL